MPDLLLGPFTEKERSDYVNGFALTYLFYHPDVPPSYARRQARMRWRNKVKKALSEISNCE
jgi:hypothetical protein